MLRGMLNLESAYDQSGVLFEELVEEIRKLRNGGEYTQDAMKKCGVSDALRAYTGMDVDFIVTQNIGYNAYFTFPLMDKNHPFLAQMGYAGYGSSAVTLQSIRDDSGRAKKGTVNLKTGKVGGYFTKVKCSIHMGVSLVSSTKFTVEEVAAIILHEAGHAWTYFEYFGNIVRKSWLIDQAAQSSIGITPPEEKVKVLVEVERQLGLEIIDKTGLLNTPIKNRSQLVESVLISDDIVNTRTESSAAYYDVRNVEQLADQFVSIHGGSRAQASALLKLTKMQGHIEAMNPAEYVAMEILKVVLHTITFAFFPVITILYAISLLPNPKMYDDPKQRIIYLKRHCINSLKNSRDPERKQALVEDIKAIEKLEQVLTERSTLFQMITNNLTTVGRKLYKQETFKKKVEEALDNDLYTRAASFEGIK